MLQLLEWMKGEGSRELLEWCIPESPEEQVGQVTKVEQVG